MPPIDLKVLGSQLKEFWNRLSKLQKILLIGGSVGITVGLIFTIWLATRIHWGLLYSGLDEKTTGEIVNFLKSQKVPYKVKSGGSIYVPEEKVPELRMEIATKGFIGGAGPGFELFDKEKLGLTEFQERVTYQRALEGELERTIMGIKGVKSVRVHLALPKESLFVEEEKPPKASVLIEMKRGYYLTPAQVRGIVNLVSGAVPKLEPQNVIVVDAITGKTLSVPLPPEEEITTTQLAYKKKIESYLKEKIEEILAKALGYGNAIAQVSVDLSFDKEKVTEEKYDPEGTAVVSEDIETVTKSSNASAEGIAGVKGALAQKFEATVPGATSGFYSRKRIVRNYDVSKTIKNLEISPGSIKKISVAVLVNKSIIKGENTLDWISALVKGAIGYNPDRGDIVEVEAIEFIKPPKKKPGKMEYVVALSKPIILLIVIILIFVFVVRPIMKTFLPKPPEVEKVKKEEVPPSITEEKEEKEEEKVVMPHEVALGIIQSQPEKAAMLVKKWLLEESLEERKKALFEAGY
jgi:flagellar M-ring protein FliF